MSNTVYVATVRLPAFSEEWVEVFTTKEKAEAFVTSKIEGFAGMSELIAEEGLSDYVLFRLEGFERGHETGGIEPCDLCDWRDENWFSIAEKELT